MDKLRKYNGITIHYYGSGKVLTGESHYTDELQDDIENLFATHFARELSHKIKSAYQHKAYEKKQAPCTRPPLGYLWDKNRREFVIDTESEELVRAIFEAYDNGSYSLSQFVNYCNENGLLPASGKLWEKGRMEKVLKNPFYCGWFRFKGGIYEGSHPAFFSKEAYDSRLARMSSNRNGSLSGRTSHLFSRFVRCPHCGRAYVAELQHGENQSGNYTYYKHRCKNSKGEIRVKEEEILSVIGRTIEEIRFSNSFRDNLKELFGAPLRRHKEKKGKEIAFLSGRIAELNDKKLRLYDLFTESEIDKLELVEKRRQYDEQIKLIQRQRDSLEMDERVVFDKIACAIELIKELPARYISEKNPAQKIQILKTMLSAASLDHEGNLRLDWKKPYGLLMREEMQEAIRENRAGLLEGPCTAGMQGSSTLSLCVLGRGLEPSPPSP